MEIIDLKFFSSSGLSSRRSAAQAPAPFPERARMTNQRHYRLLIRGFKQTGHSCLTSLLIVSLDPLGPRLIGLVVWF